MQDVSASSSLFPRPSISYFAMGADKDGDVFISPSWSQALNPNLNCMGLYHRHFKHNLLLIGLQQAQHTHKG